MKSKFVYVPGGNAPVSRIEVQPGEGDRFIVNVDGKSVEVEAFATELGIALRRDGRSIDTSVEQRQERTIVRTPALRKSFEIEDQRIWEMKSALSAGAGALKPKLNSPMTGKVVLVRVQPGDHVVAGQTLVIIEAMKMENEVKATADAQIKAVSVAAGDLVSPGTLLVEFVV